MYMETLRLTQGCYLVLRGNKNPASGGTKPSIKFIRSSRFFSLYVGIFPYIVE